MLKATKIKIEKMKAYEESLMECLGDILEKHIPHPQNGDGTIKKKKVVLSCNVCAACCLSQMVSTLCVHFQNASTEPEEGLISLSEILEVGLMT